VEKRDAAAKQVRQKKIGETKCAGKRSPKTTTGKGKRCKRQETAIGLGYQRGSGYKRNQGKVGTKGVLAWVSEQQDSQKLKY